MTVELSVRFADREVTWSIGPLWTEATELWVPLLVPPAAVIDEAQRDWITPLSGEVFTDVGARLVDGGLAWPDGLDQPAEVWDDAALDERAPHGVLDLWVGDVPVDSALATVADALAGFTVVDGHLVDSEGDPVRVHVAAPAPSRPALAPGQTAGLGE